MKNQFEPRSLITSAHSAVERAGAVIPERKPRWELQRTSPRHVLAARAEKEHKEEIRAAISEFRGPAHSAKLGIVCRKVAGNRVQIIGHGTTVDSFAEAVEFARSIGRSFVKMGAITKNL